MAERLIIRNFAGLNQIDIELGRINIFIGAQASGKSICIKCLFFFKGCVGSLIRQAIQPKFDVESLELLFEAGFWTMFEPTSLQQDSLLRYENDDTFIQVASNGQQLKITFSNFYPDLFEQVRHAAASASVVSSPEEAAFLDTALFSRFKQAATQQLGPFGASSLLFVPASRATYSLTSDLRSDSAYLTDSFLSAFRHLYASLKRRAASMRQELHSSLLEELTGEILRAEFRQENDRDFLIQATGTKTLLQTASSGQQEALPVVLSLHYLALPTRREPEAAFIEEPEAHLHPTAQHALAQLMAVVYNARSAPLQMFLTTHTPYLLTAFNNLIYAGQLADTLHDDAAALARLDAVVPPELRLHLADFRVYGLEKGQATLLIDEETGLLRADSIDSVSDTTADQFGDLLALDPATHA
jgi:hypothetical protein